MNDCNFYDNTSCPYYRYVLTAQGLDSYRIVGVFDSLEKLNSCLGQGFENIEGDEEYRVLVYENNSNTLFRTITPSVVTTIKFV